MDDAVVSVLHAYPDLFHPRGRILALGNAGGLSGSQLWKFESAFGPLALKRWPSIVTTAASIQTIHNWLRRTRSLRFVPKPVGTSSGGTYTVHSGDIWDLNPWMPGVPPSTDFIRSEQVEQAFESLALFHKSFVPDRILGPSLGLRDRSNELRLWRNDARLETRRRLANRPTSEHSHLIEQWLEASETFISIVEDRLSRISGRFVTLQPCLRDARLDHWLFEDDRLIGLIDFGAMGIESPASDIARLVGDWFGSTSEHFSTAISAYNKVIPLSECEIDLIKDFELAGDVLLGARWIRWSLFEARSFDDPEAILKGLQRGLTRISTMAARISSDDIRRF